MLFIKKFLKRRLKRRDKKKKRLKLWSKSHKRVWMYLVPNYIVSSKSKNSRMGKGKGSFVKWVIRVKAGFTFLELIKIQPKKVKNIISKINRALKVQVSVFNPDPIYYAALTHTPFKYTYYGQSIFL
jgi:ribosomal protein L16/L10AE